MAGAAGGGLTGATAGGIGILVGAVIGAIVGGIAGLFGAGFDVDEVREEIREIKDDYADAICQAKGRAINSLVACIREHCPDAAEAAEQWAVRQIGIEGCVWD